MKLCRALALIASANFGIVSAFVARPLSAPLQANVPSLRTPTSVTATVEKASSTAGEVPDFSASTKPLDEKELFGDDYIGADSFGESSDDVIQPWQESLEVLLAPNTPSAKRQIVLSDLLNAGGDIQQSVQKALKERKIDGLLTPTGKRLQDGTRAVARQLTTDILPGIVAVAAGERQIGKAENPVDVLARDLPSVVPKIGSRVLAAVSNQAKANFELLQGDLADPTRIPKRLQKQAKDVAAEARNVFSETPEGLQGPEYKVVERAGGYEIREYEGYSVASTSMLRGVDEPYSMDDLASGGEAFNALAAYLFGANEDEKVMDMTTPVTTTSTGEMRFYLQPNADGADFPQPASENDEVFNEKGAINLKTILPSRLAVKKFTGFVTEGEVARQKDALLTELSLDGVEIDVPHASVVPHVVFQYNPPYTVPILRRNEIAVPVRSAGADVTSTSGAADLVKEWDVEDSETNGSD